jgi:hypothetical protein
MTVEAGITDDQVRFYKTEGYLVLRGLIDRSHVDQLTGECDAARTLHGIVDAANLRCRFQVHATTSEPLLESLDPVTDLLPAAKQIAENAALLQVLNTLFGSQARLFKDKLIYKPKGCRGYAIHQDYIHWPFFPKSFTTVVVAVDSATSNNGCIEVFPRSHAKGYLSKPDGDFHDLPETMFENVECVQLELNPGDVAIFGCFMPHRSSPNNETPFRRQLYLSYNADHDGGDQREAHYRDFHRWLKKRYGEYGTPNTFFR